MSRRLLPRAEKRRRRLEQRQQPDEQRRRSGAMVKMAAAGGGGGGGRYYGGGSEGGRAPKRLKTDNAGDQHGGGGGGGGGAGAAGGGGGVRPGSWTPEMVGQGGKFSHFEGIYLLGGCAHAPKPSLCRRGGGGAGVGQTAGFARGQALARARSTEPGVGGRRKLLALQVLQCAGVAGWHVGAGHAAGPGFFSLSFSSLALCAGALLLSGPRGRLCGGWRGPPERELVGGGLFRA